MGDLEDDIYYDVALILGNSCPLNLKMYNQ